MIQQGSIFKAGTKINFECLPDFAPSGGSGEILCQKDGSWTDFALQCDSKYSRSKNQAFFKHVNVF